MLGIDDDKPIIIEDEYALAMMEELKNIHGLNEEQEKFYQELKKKIAQNIRVEIVSQLLCFLGTIILFISCKWGFFCVLNC